MSRSKASSVADREPVTQAQPAPPPTHAQLESDSRRQSLRLARSRALQDLQLACDTRHKAMLQQTIDHLDAAIAKP